MDAEECGAEFTTAEEPLPSRSAVVKGSTSFVFPRR